MDFIFMLTRRDRTVEDCLALLDLVRPLGLRHIGFKDVGVEAAILGELTRRIKDGGAICYMEVVSPEREASLASARTAVTLGVDRLLGGTEVDAVLDILEGSGIAYYPFPGSPRDHPTVLAGSPEEIEAHCRGFMAKGCAGADLLAYRAVDAEPLRLVRAARRGLGDGHLIVAGSIDSPERIRALAEAGVDAFTVGSAVFDGAYSPTKGSILSQLADIRAACGDAVAA